MKWEDNIKKTLEKRTIKPSDASWSALADRLDSEPKKKDKTQYWWMGVAASVVAILFTVTVFFNDNTANSPKPVIADTQQQVEKPIPTMEKRSQQEQLVKGNQEVENEESFEKKSSREWKIHT